jgi:hypothetical protein
VVKTNNVHGGTKALRAVKIINVESVIIILKDLTKILKIMRVVRPLTTILHLCVKTLTGCNMYIVLSYGICILWDETNNLRLPPDDINEF